MAGTLPPIVGGNSGHSNSQPRTSINSLGKSSQEPRKNQAYSSIVRAQQAKLGQEGHGPTTSIIRMGQQNQVTTSINRQSNTDTTTSVYGRSRGAGSESQEADDKRYEYARRKIFAKKKKEKERQLKQVSSKMKDSSLKARSFMKDVVKKYAWKKPLDSAYGKNEIKEMKTKIDQAAAARHFSDSEVEKMKKLVDKFE